MSLTLKITLKSDATFGRGEGVAGLVDTEIEYDVKTGLPFIRGRVLRGLLVEECANILFALGNSGMDKAAQNLFGIPGNNSAQDGILHVGAAELPHKLRKAIEADIQAHRFTAEDVLESLTTIRRQTAVDIGTDAPSDGSLRSMRVVLRDTVFSALLTFDKPLNESEKGLLSACVLGLRRGGVGRNRGRGRLEAQLWDGQQNVTQTYFEQFQQFA